MSPHRQPHQRLKSTATLVRADEPVRQWREGASIVMPWEYSGYGGKYARMSLNPSHQKPSTQYDVIWGTYGDRDGADGCRDKEDGLGYESSHCYQHILTILCKPLMVNVRPLDPLWWKHPAKGSPTPQESEHQIASVSRPVLSDEGGCCCAVTLSISKAFHGQASNWASTY